VSGRIIAAKRPTTLEWKTVHATHQETVYSWLADLTANVVSRYSAPEGGAFRKVESYRRGESIAPGRLPSCVIAVDALLTE
jgi:hypothetical protein